MPNYFFDSSALGKQYHPEAGTPRVQQLLGDPATRPIISRLAVAEIHSVFAGKVRSHLISAADFALLCRQFRRDVTRHRFQIVRLTALHFREAHRLIQKLGTSRPLRTLDALQLSVALALRTQALLDHFVCADVRLCAVAQLEGLPVINPELP
jgi:predicted nucleic acid-binding protein